MDPELPHFLHSLLLELKSQGYLHCILSARTEKSLNLYDIFGIFKDGFCKSTEI